MHPAAQRCHPPQVPVRPGPAARWPLPLGPPWTPSTASSSPTQETAPGSSPTFNPRVLSSSSPSHLRDSGCPYSPPLCTKLCEDAEWQCPGVEDTNPPPGVQRSRRPADSLALMWLPPAPPRFERRAQQLEGPLGRVSSLAAVNHAGGELAGSLHLRRPRKLVTSVKVGLDTRVCYPAAMDESMCGSPNRQDRGLTRGRQISPCVPLLFLSPSSEDISRRRPKEALSLTRPAPSSCTVSTSVGQVTRSMVLGSSSPSRHQHSPVPTSLEQGGLLG